MVDNFRLTVDSNTEIEPLETVRDVRMKGQSLVDNRVATIPQMTGATSSSNGSAGVVPTPSVGDREKFLRGDGTWAETSSGGSNVSVDQILDDGVNIMDITIDNVTTHIYAPESDPNAVVDVEVNGVSVVTNNVAEITITESVTDVVDANGDSLVDANGVAHVTGEVVDVVNGDGDSLVDEYGVAHVTGDITDVVDSNNTTLVDQDGVAHISAKVTDVQFEGVSILDDNNVANIKTPFITFSAPTLDYDHAAYIDESSAWKDRNAHTWVAPCDCVIYACSPNSNTVKFTIGSFTYGTYKNMYGNYNNYVTSNLYTMLPVAKGTTVTIQFVGQIDTGTTYKKIRYIPFKEASSLQGYYLQPFLDYSNKITVPWEDPGSDGDLICEYTATVDGMLYLGLMYNTNQYPILKYNINNNTSINYIARGESLSNSVILSKGDTINIYDTGYASAYEYSGSLKFIPFERTNNLSNVVSPIPDYANMQILDTSSMPASFNAGYLFNCRYDSGNNEKQCNIELTNPQSDPIKLNSDANGTFMKQSLMPLNGTESFVSIQDLCDSGSVYFVPYATINAQPFIVSDVEVNGASVVDANGVAHITGSGGSTVTITPTISTGTKIADYSIDGTSGELYAPNGGGGGGSTVSVTRKVLTGENFADITIDGVTTPLYATNTTYNDYVGATSQVAGTHGLVPSATTSEKDKFLKGDGTWGAASGAEAMTLNEYNALTTAQKNDGTVRFITKPTFTSVDMSGATSYKQSNITVTPAVGSVTTAWNGTNNNLNCVYYIPIDITNINTITYYVTTTTSFSTSSGNRLFAGITANAPTAYNWNVSNYAENNIEDTRNLTNEYRTIDVSSYTGTYYFTVKANGWNSVISGLKVLPNDNPTQIKYMSETYALEEFTGATSLADGVSGGVPAPTTSDIAKFLKGDGTWGTPDSGSDVSVTQIQSTGTKIATVTIDNVDTDLYAPNGGGGGSTVSINRKVSTGENFADITIDGVTTQLYATDTTYNDYSGATSQAAGTHGLVPSATTSEKDMFLKGDGSWDTPDAGSDVSVTQILSSGTKLGTITVDNVDTDLYAPTPTTYSDFVGTDGTAAGTHGLVPAPTASDTNKYLKSDGTWATVSGGGGVSDLDDLSDVDITTPSNGQVLKYNSTTQKWENDSITFNTSDDLFGYISTLRVSDRYASASISNHSFNFNLNDYADDWSTSATINNNTAIDITDYNSIEIDVTISEQADNGYLWLTLSTTNYTWGGGEFPSIYKNVDSAIKISESGTYSVDVSELSGNYYIYIGGTSGKNSVTHASENNSLDGKIIGSVTEIRGVMEATIPSVVANPEGEPTDTLNTIEIDGVIYDFAGGGGISGAELLWEGDFSGSGTINVPNLSDWVLVAYCNYTGTDSLLYMSIGSPSRGGGSYGEWNSNNMQTFAHRFDYDASTNTLTVNENDRGIYFGGNTTYGGHSSCHIYAIYGLVKKEGSGGSGGTIEVEQIPQMTSATAPSGIVSRSSVAASQHEGWHAFDGISASPTQLTNAWLSDSDDYEPWIRYDWTTLKKFHKISIQVTNNGTEITRQLTIEGKTGNTWENCLKSGETAEVVFYQGDLTTYEFGLNGKEYSALRITGDDRFYTGSGGSAGGFSQIQVFELENVGGNANMTELTQGEYNALTPAEKENGTMYLTHDGDEEVDLTVRMTGYTSTSGTASAVGSLNANFLAWHAFASEDTFNANVNGEYWAGDGEGAYLQFDFANAVSITKVAYASYLYSSFDLMYSTDGTTYNLAETLTQADQGTATPTKQDYILSEPIASVISIRFVCNGAYNLGALHIYGNDGNITPNRIYLNGRKYAEEPTNVTLYGIDIPTSSQGDNGNFYFRIKSYPKVDYIETTGGIKDQCINTEIKFDENTTMDIDCEISSDVYGNYQALCGWRNTQPYYGLYTRVQAQNVFAVDYNTTSTAVIATDPGIYDERISVHCASDEWTWSNGTLSYSQTFDFNGETENMYLGSANFTGAAGNEQGKYKIYDFKVYKNNILENHFVPVLYNNHGAMVDVLTGKLYESINTSYHFSYGQTTQGNVDIVISKYVKVNGTWIPF